MRPIRGSVSPRRKTYPPKTCSSSNKKLTLLLPLLRSSRELPNSEPAHFPARLPTSASSSQMKPRSGARWYVPPTSNRSKPPRYSTNPVPRIPCRRIPLENCGSSPAYGLGRVVAIYPRISLYFRTCRIAWLQLGRSKMFGSTLRSGALTFGCVLASAFSSTAGAQLLNHKDLSASIAITIAQTAIETCKANGYAVSATVVGRNGEIIVQVRGDNTGPHTLENSMRKAYTARTFRSPSGALVERLKADPTL